MTCTPDCLCNNTIDTLMKQRRDDTELLDMYRNLALAQELEIERLHVGIEALQRKLLVSEYNAI